jgi:hypothetical protein
VGAAAVAVAAFGWERLPAPLAAQLGALVQAARGLFW